MGSTHDKSGKERLSELLERLRTEAVPAKASLQGRATGRTAKTLQLAISTGLVEIPLDEIEDVSFLDASDHTLVSLEIKDSTKVHNVQPVVPGGTVSARVAGGFGGGLWGGGGLFLSSQTPTGGYYIDSVTRTGGKADKTDDTNWVENLDDWIA